MEENSYNLIEIGKNKMPLSYLIITDEKTTINSYKDSGNVIIYTNHDDSSVTTYDISSTTYTDLYIGDEHIAGGFGFVNTSQRTYVLNSAYNLIPEIRESIENIQNQFNEDGYLPEINIDNTYCYVTTDDAIYKLKYEYTYLKLLCDYKEKVVDFSVEINETTISNNDYSYISRISEDLVNDLNINKISFKTKSNDELTGFWISYITKNDSENESYLICGSSDNVLNFEDNDYFTVNKLTYDDPNIKPNIIINEIELLSTNNFINEINKISKNKNIKLILHLRFNIGNEKEIELLNINFVNPIYYSTEDLNDVNKMNSLLWKYNEDVEIKFINNDKNESKFLYIFIPDSIDVKFIQKSNNVIFDWEIEDKDILNYKCYKSPNAYKGGNPITWVLKISNKD